MRIREWRARLNNFIYVLEQAQKSNTRHYLGSFLDGGGSFAVMAGA